MSSFSRMLIAVDSVELPTSTTVTSMLSSSSTTSMMTSDSMTLKLPKPHSGVFGIGVLGRERVTLTRASRKDDASDNIAEDGDFGEHRLRAGEVIRSANFLILGLYLADRGTADNGIADRGASGDLQKAV